MGWHSAIKFFITSIFLVTPSAHTDSPMQEWAARYNGPSDSYEYARAICVSENGDVFVTGQSWWLLEDSDLVTVAYSSSGDQMWVHVYDGPATENDGGEAIEVDSAGNVYVAGYSSGNGTYSDFVTIKYDSLGNEQWLVRYNGPGNLNDTAWALEIDESGNVYVFGSSAGTDSDLDYVIVKYNSDGEEQWNTRYDGPGHEVDRVTDGAIDSDGNLYVTGWSAGDNTGWDFATVKYNSLGEELWVARFNGSDDNIDQARSIALDQFGNSFVTGVTRTGFSSATENMVTIKYDSDGNEQWVQVYEGPYGNSDMGFAVEIDPSGNVYAGGYTWVAGGSNTDFITIKYTNLGVCEWTAFYNGSDSSFDCIHDMALDSQGNIYVTGYSTGLGSGSDCTTIKYDSNGNEEWVMSYNGPGNGYDTNHGVCVDGAGNVYSVGYSEGINTAFDFVTIKYSQPTETEDSTHERVGDFYLYPAVSNPSYNLLSIGYCIPFNADVELDVFEVSGRQVYSVIRSGIGPGNHVETIRDLCTGLYLVRVQCGSLCIEDRFCVVR